MKIYLDTAASTLVTQRGIDRDRLLADLARAIEAGLHVVKFPLSPPTPTSVRFEVPDRPVSIPTLRFEVCRAAQDGPVFTASVEGPDAESRHPEPANTTRGQPVSAAATAVARGCRPTWEEAVEAFHGDEVAARRLLATYDRMV